MSESSIFRLPRGFIARALLAMAAYCMVHFVVRLVVSPTLVWDDAEQVLWAQRVSLCYGPANPPLYTWMVWGISQLTGPGALGTALVRYIVLFGMYAALVLVCGIVFEQKRQLVYAMGGYLLIYEFAVNAHQLLTHSTLASAAIAWTLLGLLLVERRRTGWAYGVLGTAIAVGILSKPNYLVFLAGLLGAAFVVPVYRKALMDRRTLAASAVIFVLCLPYWASATASHVRVQKVAESLANPDGLRNPDDRALAIPRTLQAAVSYPLPFWVVILAAFPHLYTRRHLFQPREPYRLMLGIQLLVSVVLMAIAATVLLADGVRVRWMSPALLLLPIYLVGGLHREHRRPRAERAYIFAVLLLSVMVVVVRLADDRLEPRWSTTCRKTVPVYLLDDPVREMGFADAEIVGRSIHLAGNLAALFPDATVYTVQFGHGPTVYPLSRHRCLYVWRGPPTPIPPDIIEHTRLTGHRLADHVSARRCVTVPYPQCPDCTAQFTLWVAEPRLSQN